MIRVNLLPHRELKRKQQQRDFIVMVCGVLGVAGAIWFAVHTYLAGQLEDQKGRNTYLESEIAILDKQIEEIKRLKEQTAQLLARKKVVESLQANRNETVHLIDQLVRQLPDGVYLKSVRQQGNRVTINGLAQSNARVSTLMRNLESSPWLERPNLVEIKAVSAGDKAGAVRLSDFTLSVTLTRAADDDKKPARKQG